MKLSLGLILEQLQFELEQPLEQYPSFSSVELYLLGGSDLSGASLLIAPLSEALMVPKQKGIYFLCIRDRMVDYLESEDSMQGICVVKKNLELRELFNAVQRVFVRIHNWAMQMQESVIKNKGLQELMNLSEPILGNHIAVMDAAFRLMAYTKNIETDDEVTNELVTHGYHPEETVKRFRKNRRIEQYEMADENEVIISDDKLLSDYVTVKKVYKYNNTFFILVIMVCCHKNCSGGLLELFQMLLENIRYYVEREHPSVGGKTPTELLFTELIDKSLHLEEEARKRASYIHLPFEGYFDLNLLVFSDTLNTPVSRVVRELSSELPEARVILYGRDILVLNLYREEQSLQKAQERRDRVWNRMGEQITCCGISNVFYSLWDLSTAYEQARAAVSAGERLRALQPREGGPHYYSYEDYYLYHVVEHCMGTLPDVFTSSFAFEAIKKLQEYENKHKTKTLQLLHTYLKCERNATETCTLMHMHRNTVLYHIGKVEDLLGVSLDNVDTRTKLLLGFKACELGRI